MAIRSGTPIGKRARPPPPPPGNSFYKLRCQLFFHYHHHSGDRYKVLDRVNKSPGTRVPGLAPRGVLEEGSTYLRITQAAAVLVSTWP